MKFYEEELKQIKDIKRINPLIQKSLRLLTMVRKEQIPKFMKIVKQDQKQFQLNRNQIPQMI